MKRIFLGIALIGLVMAAAAQRVVSPNGKLMVETKGNGLVVSYNNQQVLDIPAVGYEGSQVVPQLKETSQIKADYWMLSGKRLHCTNTANEYRASLGEGVQMVVRLYNDGLAFRYELSGLKDTKLPKEQTAYRIPEGTKRWMQQWTDSYESFFPLTTTYKITPIPSFSGISKSADGYNIRWGYPSLLEPVKDVFALISEADIGRRQSASCLYNDGELYRVVPDANNLAVSDEWHSPWRVVIIGRLSDIVESTLITDVSEPCRLTDTSWIHPGVVSWVYWAYNHGSNDYNIIKKYVDMAATLHLPYVLIDAEWDTMKDGKTVVDAVNYANEQGVRPLIWYNSSVGWVDGAPTPKYRLNKPEDREKEFAWCEKIGVAGVKVDFFSGDNQMNMDYCIELLECAARHHLLINFHGATIPRGWQRTYPNLLSTEGVYGAEWYNNVGTFTNKAAAHNATLPFTRNVIGPMDYTPCAFSDSQHPHITSHAHELALTVLFESGLQHLADRPESFLAQPQEVQDFLGQLPSVWDETRLLSGYPGEYVVMARRSGTIWYIAGINGSDDNKDIPLNIKGLTSNTQYQTFFDSGDSAKPWNIRMLQTSKMPSTITCQPRGGFVVVAR
ncbi:MAG: glycoside hydrolase family 97 catalytic domain-containing protein [Prevotella sp.]|nr:glycoside hydrolase family 97 catalytic domain-containing protein [Prevotella sp.]